MAQAAAALERALSLRESERLRLLLALLAESIGQTVSNPLVHVLGGNARMWEDAASREDAAGDRVESEIDRQLAVLIRAVRVQPQWSGTPLASFGARCS